MISPQPNWIPDPTKNAVKTPRVNSSGLHGEGATQLPLIGRGAIDNGRVRVARHARIGMQRMSPVTMAWAIVMAAPFVAILLVAIYQSALWLETLAIGAIFLVRHRRRTAERHAGSAKADDRIRLPNGRNDRGSTIR